MEEEEHTCHPVLQATSSWKSTWASKTLPQKHKPQINTQAGLTLESCFRMQTFLHLLKTLSEQEDITFTSLGEGVAAGVGGGG